jgi:hypothetical protein
MKRLLAIVLAVMMLSAMTSVSLAAYEKPQELVDINASDIGVWPMAAGAYDPSLDGQGIPDGTNIYGLFEMDAAYNITPFTNIPASLAGYTTVSTPAELVPGSYCLLHITGFAEYDYALVLGADGAAPADIAPPADTAPVGGGTPLPPELASASSVGVWPMAAGAYDPSLDGQGIPDGTNIFGLFDMDAAYNITPFADIPASLAGYTTVSSPAELVPGSYYVLHITGLAEYDYALVMGTDGPIEVTPPAPPTGGDATTPDAPDPVAPAPAPSGESGEVYFTAVVNGKVEVAAQPLVPDTMTFESVLLKAHEMWYKDGVSGYAAGIDASFNMYLITMAWGVSGTPFNSQGDQMLAATVDTAAVKPGDNIIMTASGAASAVTLKASEGEDEGTILITATSWALDMTTWQYMGTKVSGGRVVDSDGNEFGTTGGDGTLVVEIPDDEDWDGVVILEGMAAINVLKSISAPAEPLDGNARTVYFTVKLDSALAPNAIAVPVKLTKNAEVGEQRTIEGALRRFHELYFNNGENGLDGYAQGAKIWGVEWKDRGLIRPKLALNDRLIDISDPGQLDEEIMPDYNFLISISTNAQQEPIAAYMDIYINSIIAYGDAYLLEYGENGETIKKPLGAGYALMDAETPPNPLISPDTSVMETAGEGVLTDENGHFVVNTPSAGRVGIVVLQGLTACNTIYSAAYPVFKGPDGFFTLWLLLVGVGGAIPLGIIVAYAMHIEIKNRGIKYSKSKFNTGSNLMRGK